MLTGGKGTVRRKVVRKPKPSAAQDDKKLQGALKKLNVQPITGVEEVNMFREDGNVLHFTAPKGELSIFRTPYPSSASSCILLVHVSAIFHFIYLPSIQFYLFHLTTRWALITPYAHWPHPTIY